ncbi:MAG: hypothetical protein KJO65_04715 [Gemmatimonadetes bacterium]|nr:hypothetical protein [Gemmatimonadota bacterium]
MRKTVALLALLVLTMPYLRAPLCQAGSHEHPEDMSGHDHEEHAHAPDAQRDKHSVSVTAKATQAASVAVAATNPGDAGCHERMKCDAALDLVSLPVPEGRSTRVAQKWASAGFAESHLDVRLGLDLPPPRRI